ncbi:hypothetical protein PQR37_10395 [Paraburkholderia nemoris]|uniref:hypothetical protein n=1 Tax=Paraburkholderia TaxID=1822464 RepID=UPI0038BE065C
MKKMIAAAAFVVPILALVFRAVMWPSAPALLIFGWNDPASGQETARVSHEAIILSDCQNLMNNIRQRYGRAPLCLKVINPGGPSATELDGIVGLADDMTNPWYEMRFTTEVGDPTVYHYAQSDLNNVIMLIQHSHHGLTEEQMDQVVTGSACGQVESRLKAARNAGTLTEREYQMGLSDVRKTIKGCTK